jgi:uncharacterized protein with GYD domain
MRVLILANYGPNAIKGLMHGADREAVLRASFESVGGKFLGLAFTRGAYDVVVTGDVPNQAAAMGIAMAVRATGSVTDTCVLEELNMAEVVKAANSVAKAYKPAG